MDVTKLADDSMTLAWLLSVKGDFEYLSETHEVAIRIKTIEPETGKRMTKWLELHLSFFR